MGDLIPISDRPLHGRSAADRIKALWKDGSVVWTHHAEHQMKARKIDMTDIQHIIRYGRVVSHERGRQRWRYRVEGRCVDGKPAVCIVEVNGLFVIVTAFFA
jgi:hypothetical protein